MNRMNSSLGLLSRAPAFFTVALTASVALTAFFTNINEAHASRRRHWERIEIPGAKCGDGSQYSVFVSPKDPKKIMFDFMGGGACWSMETCYLAPIVWTHPIPFPLEPGGMTSGDDRESPVTDHTMVYFPYCTGDVHLGQHVATYHLNAKVHHVGRTNFQTSVNHLTELGWVDLGTADEFVFFGASAGAIGALFHMQSVDRMLPPHAKRFLIADSPGLHWGEKFWDKFTPALLADYSDALAQLGGQVRRGEGRLAGMIPEMCRRYPEWTIGVLQGARDFIMSRIFGAISMKDHERNVFGRQGVYQLTMDPKDNCSSWVPRSAVHTFLLSDRTARISTFSGKSAKQYVFDFLREGRAGSNHR